MARSDSSKVQADIFEKRHALHRRILLWREVQLAYMPFVAPLLVKTGSMTLGTDDDISDSVLSESIPLYLPSSLPPNQHHLSSLIDKEFRLRKAQADEALEDIRRGRRMITGLVQFKKLNISGAGNAPNTRMRALYDSIQGRIQRAANTYRTAYTALLALEPDGTWKSRFQVLNTEDIRGPGRQSDDPTPNSRYQVSWIWLVGKTSHHSDSVEEEFDDVMRVEWAKTKARYDRWNEEYQLLQEEMRRTVVYLEWRARWWRNQISRRVTDDAVLAQGLHAYAKRQAYQMDMLAASCVKKWVPLLKEGGADISWAAKYGVSGSNMDNIDECNSEEEVEEEEEEEEKEKGENILDTDDLLYD